MTDTPSGPAPAGARPRVEFLGTIEHDCRSDLPADSPVRDWPVLDAFPRFEFLGTTEADGIVK
jgi:hypothetical protein